MDFGTILGDFEGYNGICMKTASSNGILSFCYGMVLIAMVQRWSKASSSCFCFSPEKGYEAIYIFIVLFRCLSQSELPEFLDGEDAVGL